MSDYDTTEAMILCGGSFVSALGKLYRLADDDNQARLKRAFPEYFIQYQELASLLAANRRVMERRAK